MENIKDWKKKTEDFELLLEGLFKRIKDSEYASGLAYSIKGELDDEKEKALLQELAKFMRMHNFTEEEIIIVLNNIDRIRV